MVVVVDVELVSAGPRASAFACRLRRDSPPSLSLRRRASFFLTFADFFVEVLASASSAAFSFLNSPRVFGIDFRVARVERLNGVDDRRRDHQSREPLAIRRHHVPRRRVRWRCGESCPRRRSCSRRSASRSATSAGENFQCFSGFVEPLQEALALFLLRHVQEELAHHHALARQVALAGVDVFEALTPDVLGDELAAAAAGARGCSGGRARPAFPRSTSD